MENEEQESFEPRDRTVPEYSAGRVLCVVLLAYLAGCIGAAVLFVILFAPCGFPWLILKTVLGEGGAPLAVFSGGGGFASGCFISLHLPNARWRFLLLFLGNPSFLLFAGVAASVQMNRPWELAGITVNSASLYLFAFFLALGGLSAVLGDWYAWRRAEEVGAR